MAVFIGLGQLSRIASMEAVAAALQNLPAFIEESWPFIKPD